MFRKNMILLLTMMILMTFAIWFVQFGVLIIHCQFCHGQVYTSMGFKHKTGAGDLFLMTIILLLMLSVPNIWKRTYNFTFYLSDICFHRFHFSVQSRGLYMLVATWPSWIGIEKVEKVHGKAWEKNLKIEKATWFASLFLNYPIYPNRSITLCQLQEGPN